MIGAYCILSPDSLVPNLLLMYTREKKVLKDYDELAMMKIVCTVCGERNCPRHRPELNILAFQPWTNLVINKKVDEALEEFLNIVLKEFVYTWYKDLSSDEEFVDELKSSIRFLAAVLFRRIKKLDIPKLVTEKIIKAALQHLDCCIQAQKRASDNKDIQQATINYLGSNVHCSMWNRKAELEYLRCMVECLFPYVLKPEALHSKSTCTLVREILANLVLLPAMDAIANPDMVNNLILIFLDETPPPEATEPPSELVPFLDKFSIKQPKKPNCLRLEMKHIMDKEQPVLLYAFMQFLKKEAAVNVLQFCLACDDFNRRLLSPDLSQSEFHELHAMAKDLYKNFCDPTAVDRIKFDEKIIAELKNVIDSPPEQIIRLQKSFTLFQAYEHAYDLLENTFLPLFHQSDDVRTLVHVSPWQIKKFSTILGKKKEFGFSNLGTKLKGVFKSSSGIILYNMAVGGEIDITTPPVTVNIDRTDEENGGKPKHDLSTWRVTIPMIGARPDPENMKKQYFVFIIDVARVDIPDGEGERTNWTVARKYGEFYVLEQKLTEFHGNGEFPDCQLPPKKSFGTKNKDFIEGKKEVFEQYLQKLLTKPLLKGSELVYSFLTSLSEFNSSFLQDINIGIFVKSVPMKLVKEKGQHLDPFLSAFAASTEAPKPKSMSPKNRSLKFIVNHSKKLTTSLFENNSNCGFNPPKSTESTLTETRQVDGVFDSLVYIATCVYYVPKWFISVLMTCRILIKETLESYVEWYLDYKITQVTQEHRVVSIIHLLQDVLFFDTDPPRSDEEKKSRYNETVEGCLQYVPRSFVSMIGDEKFEKRTKFILDILQQPKLNKQLSYVLLDILISELFPELKS
ncbi:hypothetical protein LOTGIDRAFT_184319 [Lottia gigantea]|uniref:Sorting nexin-14 n=1 Tax=Lottia gigantea TaxID=225164 RepID=V3ZP10_LOTGI|nr:hypothetical protein LOTGIDRAFT_184319 [Lottia gigantea]ESO84230.1 hypothetical protein LOTGIDRAFT_184319 [Lottia gigantea]